jgi:hypothetical protein
MSAIVTNEFMMIIILLRGKKLRKRILIEIIRDIVGCSDIAPNS